MEQKRLLSLVRQAVDKYSMIDNNDKIAVGLSGGKDSLTLLYALSKLQAFYPNRFELTAVTVDLGFDNLNLEAVTAFCRGLNIKHEIIHTDIAKIVFEARKEANPCSLCAKMRKGALNNYLNEIGFNKVAYAHHKDDLIETMFLSLLYEGRLHTFEPKTYLDHSKITVIRPLLYINEADVIGFTNKMQLPVCKSPCPVDKHTKREYVKQLINNINHENHGVRDKIFTAIINSTLDGFNDI